MDRRRFLNITAGGAVATGLPAAAPAQTARYPARPIKVMVPWPVGGNADVTIRPILEKMSQQMGSPIVVENRAGATGTTGTAIAARAAADGYNLLQLSSSTVFNIILSPEKANFDLQRDFAPIGLAASTPLVLEVHPSVPAATLQELIAYAKANPGKMTYASGGVGTSAHLLAELMKLRAGLDITHVPYQGGAPAVADLMGGHVNMYFDVLPTALPAVRSGRVRILGITSARRSPSLPDVPTFAELGLPEIEASVWVAMLAPKSTDAAIVEQLNQQMNRALADPQVRQQLTTIGAEPMPGTPAALASFIKAETDKWADVVRRARIKADS
ncbi:MAG: Bug family tripartite tricarboxylate transporter substrate binding protein [Lautropia sp.]